MPKRPIKIAHSPDSDDAFMFWALKTGKIVADKYDFEIERRDIEELNQLAKDQIYDITAISFHAYAYLTDKYVLTASGSSFAALDYGPVVVGRQDSDPSPLRGEGGRSPDGGVLSLRHPPQSFGQLPPSRGERKIAIPGKLTTAALLIKLIAPELKTVVVPFEKIIDHVLGGITDLGLLIHEGQLVYEELGLKKEFALIDYWKSKAGDLPLPLGGSSIKKSLGPEVISDLAKLQQQSIAYAQAHQDEAIEYAREFKRDMTPAQLKKYLGWYANDLTLDMGEVGKMALDKLFTLAYENGALNKKIKPEIV